jgi:hypothetical protein
MDAKSIHELNELPFGPLIKRTRGERLVSLLQDVGAIPDYDKLKLEDPYTWDLNIKASAHPLQGFGRVPGERTT